MQSRLYPNRTCPICIVTVMRNVSTVIVGGGITGAALLHRLASRGDDVLLLEAADRLGGVIRSRRTPYGTLQESGPNSTISSCELQELIDELGLDDSVVVADASARKRYVIVNGELEATPTGPGDVLRSKLFSPAGKLRLLREPFIPRRHASSDESVAEFVTRRLGREALDYAVDPFVSGVYAGNARELSLRSAFPTLHALEAEHGGLVRGMIARLRARRKARAPRPRRRGMISLVDGMEMLPRRIHERWHDHVRINSGVTAMWSGPAGWVVETNDDVYACKNLVLAIPAGAAARLVAQVPSTNPGALKAIPYVPVVSVASTYRREYVGHPLDGFGCLAPSVEGRRVLGIVFASSVFNNRAPKGTVVVRTLIGGARAPELAGLKDEAIEELVANEHAALIGVVAPPISTTIERMPAAIPQYNRGHADLVSAIDEMEERNEGLFFAGSYRGGVSVGECVRSAFELADRIAAMNGAEPAAITDAIEAVA